MISTSRIYKALRPIYHKLISFLRLNPKLNCFVDILSYSHEVIYINKKNKFDFCILSVNLRNSGLHFLVRDSGTSNSIFAGRGAIKAYKALETYLLNSIL